MNCQSFESLVSDLARGGPLEARARAEARDHEAACARCAARLADERALSEGLRGLAEETRTAAAPPRVEANLLAAFRARAATPDEKVLPFARPSAPRRWSWVKTAAASAAAAAAAVTLFVLVAPQQAVPPRAAQTEEATRAALTPPDVTEKLTAVNTSAGGGLPDEAAVKHPHIVRGDNFPRVASVRAAGRLTTTPASYRKDGGRAARPPRSADAGAEIATSFIPLTYDAALAASDGGQVVRIELPRTALQRFGLPMNFERAGGRVKADLFVGHDGVARAIRFVR